MINNGFKKGLLTSKVKVNVAPAEIVALACEKWKNGYIAFANGEKRLDCFDQVEFDQHFFSDRIQDIAPEFELEGYVTELNLWRNVGNTIEEIAIEREENNYFIQHFHLDMTAPDSNCWYRDSDTIAGSHHNGARQIFSGKLSSVEVVWPEKRLNIFITVGE